MSTGDFVDMLRVMPGAARTIDRAGDATLPPGGRARAAVVEAPAAAAGRAP